MTHVLAQTVYGLDLSDLPLNKLELDNHHRSRQFRPRARTSQSSAELNKSRMSFSRVHFMPSSKLGSPPSKLGSVSHFADDKVTRNKLRKSNTEVHEEKSPPYSPPTRGTSVPFIPPSDLEDLSGKFRSISTVVPPKLEELEPEFQSLPPGRSVSAGDTYRPHQEMLGDLPEEATTPSPIFSLPPGLVGSSSRYQKLHEGETTSTGIIENPLTASPVSSRRKAERDTRKNGREAAQTHGWEGSRKTELESKQRVFSPGQLKGQRPGKDEGLVLQNRDLVSPEPDPAAVATTKFTVSLPAGLVLENENPRDSMASTVSDTTPTPLAAKPTVLDAGADKGTSGLGAKPRASTVDRLSPEFPRRSSLIYKSSSESNITRFGINTPFDGESFRSKTLEDSGVRMRRVVSSGSTEGDVEAMVRESLDDPFASAIIPNSREGVISPQLSSPIRTSPQPLLSSLGRDARESPRHNVDTPG